MDIKENNRVARTQSMKNAVSKTLASNIPKVKEYQGGDTSLIGFFMGEAMKFFTKDGAEDETVNTVELLSILEENLREWKEVTNDGKYINSIKFIKDMIPFKDGEEFEFRKGVNLFVGDQGCGKSTMLHVMMHDKSEYGEVVKVDRNPFAGDYIYLDTERHNPRNLSGESGGRADVAAVREYLTFAVDKNNADGNWLEHAEWHMKKWLNRFGGESEMLNTTIISRFKSHGETLLPMLENFVDAKTGLVFIDEPETALSMRSQYRFVEIIKKARDNKCQVFVSTHSRIIIEGVAEFMDKPEILSLEHRCWMSPEKFIKTQQPESK